MYSWTIEKESQHKYNILHSYNYGSFTVCKGGWLRMRRRFWRILSTFYIYIYIYKKKEIINVHAEIILIGF
jgi:hypothetical protein